MKNAKLPRTNSFGIIRGRQLKIKNLNERGVSLIITMLILSILMVISLQITTLILGEAKLNRGIENSTLAYFAADSGAERILFDIRNAASQYVPNAGDTRYADTALGNGAIYTVKIIETSPAVRIQSGGTYSDTKRSVEITY